MEETIRGERNTWKERIYPSKHTKENRRSGLGQIQKDGEIQTQYGYDAFGNRTWKEERGEQTSYQYNALNQLVSERQGEIRKEYGYDKRGNLTAILENGAWKKRYVYGAMNRLEEAVDAAGKQAR